MSVSAWSVTELLPHAGPAVLLDAVLDSTDTGLSAGVTITPASAFHQIDGVPAHIGLEYMAQACGAFSGVRARREGALPRMGFILGTRRYLATRAWFSDGEQLVIAVALVYQDDEIGVFDCTIRSAAAVVATAQLIVAEPRDVATLFGRRDTVQDG